MVTIQQIEKEDVKNLVGRYIIQLNRDKHDLSFEKNISFYAEKRISIVTIMVKDRETKYFMAGIYYNHSSLLTPEEFIDKFNSYGKDRYYRLMTKEEVSILNNYIFEKSPFII